MYKIKKFSKNRQFIHDLLHRAKTFHLPISTSVEIDCTEAQAKVKELQSQGKPASFTAFMVLATGKLLEKHPYLNSHLFTKWTGKKVIVEFDDINCNLVIQRIADDGENILLPLIIPKANEKSLKEIVEIIQHHKVTPLKDLPQFQVYEKIKKMPLLLLRYISYKTRSDPDFYIKYYGTYGISAPNPSKNKGAIAVTAVANTTVAFIPYSIFEEGGRHLLRITLVMDHYVLDGLQIVEAGHYLKELIENPRQII